MNIKNKLIAVFLGIGLIPLTIVTALLHYQTDHGLTQNTVKAQKLMEKEVFQKLTSVRELKQKSVERYFNMVRNQILTFSENRMVIDAMKNFKKSFRTYRSDLKIDAKKLEEQKAALRTYYVNDFDAEYVNQNKKSSQADNFFNMLDKDSIALQYSYIKNNRYPLGSKHKLDKSKDSTAYSSLHEKVHPSIRSFLEKFGYYDIFLVDDETGDIVYSVFKELDYSASLIDGPYSDSNFGECFRKANQLMHKDGIYFVDLKPYTPSYEAPASFIASPIFSQGKKVGIAMFQMPLDKITEVMSDRSGLGETGETYLVGPDGLMRSDSFRQSKTHTVSASFANPKAGSVMTSAVEKALQGKFGYELITSYHGKHVLSAYAPVEVVGIRWGLIAEVESEEAFLGVSEIEAEVKKLNASKLLYTAISFVVATIIIILIAQFMAKNISTPLNRASDNSLSVNTSAQVMSTEINKVACSIDEMSQVIKEIAGNCENAATASVDAVKLAGDSEQKINALSKVSEEITGVLESISKIAEKTDLLALNATIEAASAGEAGRGFAVVANEVQQLANQTSNATVEITNKIHDIQASSKESSDAILNIASANKNIEGTTTTLASAIEELSLTITDINRSISEVSNKTSSVTSSIGEVSDEIAKITQGSKRNIENTSPSEDATTETLDS